MLDDHEKFNEFIKFISYWLQTYKSVCFKLLNKQANLTNELNKMNKAAKAVITDDDDEDDDEDNELNTKDNDGELDFTISYDDFKIGFYFT